MPTSSNHLSDDFDGTCVPRMPAHHIHHLFDKAMPLDSDRTAVICADKALSYGNLDAQSSRLAHRLLMSGVKPGVVVAVALDRCIELPVVFLAIFKAGGCYVPIDHSLPEHRIMDMVDNARPALFLVNNRTCDTFSHWKDVCFDVEEILVDSNDIRPRWASNERHYHLPNVHTKDEHKLVNDDSHRQKSREDIAYVIYTSGSTGKPKGVEMGHGALSSLLLHLQNLFGPQARSRLLALCSISFDIHFIDIFLPLLCGGVVVIAQTHELKDPAVVIDLMRRHSVDMIIATPTMWEMLLATGLKNQHQPQHVISTGEALSRSLANRLLSCGQVLWNFYGPSETQVASVARVAEGEDVSVGYPVSNNQLFVVDKDLQPLPIGEPGELMIGGATLAMGYRNDFEMTRARFVCVPFMRGRFYRTGDLARFTTPDHLVVMGRLDRQIKIRGHRVEPGDVEVALTEHSHITSAAVICRDERLVAYYVRGRDTSIPTAEDFSDGIRSWMMERLPAYMVPAVFMELDSMPMSSNGKTDLRELPDPFATTTTTPKVITPSTTKSDGLRQSLSGLTSLEACISAAWARALGHDRFGHADNFFHVGGNSVRVVQVRNELQDLLDTPISVAKLFEHHTVSSLAAFIAQTTGTGAGAGAGTHSISMSADLNTCKGDDIAIVSMACRLPGGVDSLEKFWDALSSGRDLTSEVPLDRWSAESIYDIDVDAIGTSNSKRGGFISNPSSYDALFFGISPREAQSLDPLQYIMLETCWDAFELGGYTMKRLQKSQTGVFIGISSAKILDRLDAVTLNQVDGYSVTNTASSVVSGRISYTFDLEGPSMTIDTACSSSLVSMHLACAALRQGECDMAVAGGISIMTNPGLQVGFSRLNGQSADGRCRAFGADSQGAGFSEGAAVLVLKRLADATRDGDSVRAVLRGSAITHGGRGANLTTPNGPAQQRAVQKSLKLARLQPGDIDYIEAHGTGTKLGDPIEASALAEVFSSSRLADKPLPIGSVKSNLGHTQAAAGLVGVIKVVLAMQHSCLPPTLFASRPTPEIDWERSRLSLVQERRAWPSQASRRRRAGVSAFGISGTHAHAILEEAPNQTASPLKEHFSEMSPSLLILSAKSEDALRGQIANLQHWMEKKASDDEYRLVDLAYSLATSRNHYNWRLALHANCKSDLLEQLNRASLRTRMDSNSKLAPRLAFLFSGQGGLWPGMGRELSETVPVFRDAMKQIASYFKLDSPLLDVMWAQPDSAKASMLHRTEYAQPALFTLQVCLWRLWQYWGVRPEAVLGHSVGEMAAAHVAGVLELGDACRLVSTRAKLMQGMPSTGSMISVQAGPTQVSRALSALRINSRVDVAAHNSPEQTVVSGDREAIERVKEHFARQGYKTSRLETSHAFHSHHMDSMLDEYRTFVEKIHFHSPQIEFISTVTGSAVTGKELAQASYWTKQVRSTVVFREAMEVFVDRGFNTFLELGPGSTLCGVAAACLEHMSALDSRSLLSSLHPKKTETFVVQQTLATLHLRRLDVDWDRYYEPFQCRVIDLPTYAFQRKHYPALPQSSLLAKVDSTDEEVHEVSHLRDTNGADPKLNGSAPPKPNRSALIVNWRTVLQSPESHLAHKRGFRLICPQEVSWTREVRSALQDAGLLLVPKSKVHTGPDAEVIVCLWHSDPIDGVEGTTAMTAQACAQLQEVSSRESASPIIWVTNRAIGVDDEDRVEQPASAVLWGLGRSAQRENPQLRLRLIDLSEDADNSFLTMALGLNNEAELAVRKRGILAPSLEQASAGLEFSLPARPIRTDGTFLLTGGLGGVGQRIALWLAHSYGVRSLVILSRCAESLPGTEVLLNNLREIGCRTKLLSCDLRYFDAVKSAISTITREAPLRGIVHAAGYLSTGLISSLAPRHFDDTFASKVLGTWNLHCLTQRLDLDMFVVTSSIAGIMGLPGLAPYSAANTFLDSLAQFRRSRGLPATSVAYGAWGGNGMASSLDNATLARFARMGLSPLPPDEALNITREAISSGRSLTIAVALEMDQLIQYYALQGDVPPLYSALLGRKEGSRAKIQEPAQCEPSPKISKISSGTISQQTTQIDLHVVREIVAQALGIAQSSDIDDDIPLQDYGVDSLAGVLIRNQLSAKVGFKLPPNIALLHPTIASLSKALCSIGSGAVSDKTVLTPASTPEQVKESASYLDMTALRKGYLDRNLSFCRRANFVSPSSVLITGATGFIGSLITSDLLKKGVHVHCLIRAADLAQARRRLDAKLLEIGDASRSFNHEHLMHPVLGDLSKPLFALNEESFDRLAESVDAICHCGALVDWMRPLEDYIGPNMVSTHEVLRLASRGRHKSVHVISTIATLPYHMGIELDPHLDQDYGYGTSKFLSEKLVSAARWRGASAFVYRVPYVTASTSTGYFRSDRGDFLHNLITGSLEIGAFPTFKGTVSTIFPVDYIAKAVVEKMTLGGPPRDYDFLNQHAMSFTEFFKLFAGNDTRTAPFNEWMQRVSEEAEARPHTRLARAAIILDGFDEAKMSEMMSSLPVGEYVYGEEKSSQPVFDESFAQKYIDRIRSKQ